MRLRTRAHQEWPGVSRCAYKITGGQIVAGRYLSSGRFSHARGLPTHSQCRELVRADDRLGLGDLGQQGRLSDRGESDKADTGICGCQRECMWYRVGAAVLLGSAW